MRRSKEPIKLRQRRLRNGNISLYLDLCIDNRREYEFLKLYLVPERTKADRDANKRTLALAEIIKADRITKLRNERFGLADNRQRVVYLLPILESLKARNQFKGIVAHLSRLVTEKTTSMQVTPQWVRKVCNAISKDESIMQSSRSEYLDKFKTILRSLAKDGCITHDSLDAWFGVGKVQAEREFLTADEVRRLVDTPCTDDVVKRMFLFSCFTGLRLSDCRKLTWDDVEDTADRSRIVFRQQKTKQLQYTDLNADARAVMGVRRAGLVFHAPSRGVVNKHIADWVSGAGIRKHITFHCARHTFATLLLTADVNLYVVSKLLGHASVKTTEIYAKVVDKKRRDAVDTISGILNNVIVTDLEQDMTADNSKPP